MAAGIQAVKRTSDLIPFCHGIAEESCQFDVIFAESLSGKRIQWITVNGLKEAHCIGK